MPRHPLVKAKIDAYNKPPASPRLSISPNSLAWRVRTFDPRAITRINASTSFTSRTEKIRLPPPPPPRARANNDLVALFEFSRNGSDYNAPAAAKDVEERHKSEIRETKFTRSPAASPLITYSSFYRRTPARCLHFETHFSLSTETSFPTIPKKRARERGGGIFRIHRDPFFVDTFHKALCELFFFLNIESIIRSGVFFRERDCCWVEKRSVFPVFCRKLSTSTKF